MLNVGVIGLGSIAWSIDNDPSRKGIWSHIGAYDKSPHTQIHAVSGRDEDVCKQIQEKYAVPNYFTDYRVMLDAGDLDIVSICTPIKTHYSIVMDCTDANVKGIFCEKTLSYDIGEAEEMVDACQDRGVTLAVNFIKRWDNRCIRVNELLATGTIGNLQTIVAYGATALHTSTSHLIDLMCLYADKPLWVVGENDDGFVRNVHGIDDPGGIGMVKFENGVVGFIKGTSLTSSNYMSELDLNGTHGRIRLTDDGKTLSIFRFRESASSPGSGFQTLLEEKSPVPAENERMLDAVADIVECIRIGRQPKSSGHSSLDALRIIDGIRRSSENDNVKIRL